MGREIRTVSAIFMLISGGTALFLSLMGLYPFALLMVFFFTLFFAGFVAGAKRQSNGWQKVTSKEPKEKKKKFHPNVRYMRYCSSCGFLGSQKPREDVPPCPVCGHRLLATDTSLKVFSAMTNEQRETMKKTWSYLG